MRASEPCKRNCTRVHVSPSRVSNILGTLLHGSSVRISNYSQLLPATLERLSGVRTNEHDLSMKWITRAKTKETRWYFGLLRETRYPASWQPVKTAETNQWNTIIITGDKSLRAKQLQLRSECTTAIKEYRERGLCLIQVEMCCCYSNLMRGKLYNKWSTTRENQ